MTSNLGECAFARQGSMGWTVEKTWHPEFAGGPFCERRTGGERVVDRGSAQWHERDDIDHTEPWVDTIRVATEVEKVDGPLCQVANRRLTDEREDRAVVVMIRVDVQQVSPTGSGQIFDKAWISPLADVGDALEHEFTLPGRDSGHDTLGGTLAACLLACSMDRN